MVELMQNDNPGENMKFTWIDYIPEHAALADSWLDETAMRETGLDEGWAEYLGYWLEEPGAKYGENLWCRLILRETEPVAVIALGEENGEMVVSEIVVDPAVRGQGIGSAALAELLANHERIIGKPIKSAMAVIFPDNTASQKAFERAGFRFDSAHPDGDAWYYRWYNR